MAQQEFLCLSAVFQNLLGAFTKYRFLGVPQTYRIRPEPLAPLSSVTTWQENVWDQHIRPMVGGSGCDGRVGLFRPPSLGAHLHPLHPRARPDALCRMNSFPPRVSVLWKVWTLWPFYFIRTPLLKNSDSQSSLPLVNEIPIRWGEGAGRDSTFRLLTPPPPPRPPRAPSPCSLLLSHSTGGPGPGGQVP